MLRLSQLILQLLLICYVSCLQPSAPDEAFLNKVESIAADSDFSGSVLIAFKDKMLVDKGFGFADSQKTRPNTPDTIFPIASITKLFVRHSVFLLVEQGRLGLDDQMRQYLPEVMFSDKIKISDLVYHTSGLPDIHNELPEFNDPWNLKGPVSARDLIEKINSLNRLHFQPGSESRYSNTNYLLLAMIIEKISGLPLDRFLSDNIFGPFGMKNTGLYRENSRLPGHAEGFLRRGGSIVFLPDFNFRNFWGSGNAYSTTRDLYQYLKLIKRNLKPEYSSRLVQHSGYYSGYRTFIKSVPEIDLAIIILSNYGNFNPDFLINETYSYVDSRLEPYRGQPPLEYFAGDYQAGRFDTKDKSFIFGCAGRASLFVTISPSSHPQRV